MLQGFPEKSVYEDTGNTKQINNKVSKKSIMKHKRRKDVITQESNHSSDSENVSPRKVILFFLFLSFFSCFYYISLILLDRKID